MERESIDNPRNSNWLWILLAVVALAGLGYWYYAKQQTGSEKPVTANQVDTTKKTPAAPIVISNEVRIVPETSGEEGVYFERYQVIERGAIGFEEPTGKEIAQAFGTVVYRDAERSNSQETWGYLVEPKTGQAYPTAYRFKEMELIPSYQFDDYKKNFSLAPFDALAASYKQLILQNNRYNGNDYTITQNAERAKSTYSTGDFDGDGIPDLAVVLDNNEKQFSRLLILSFNEKTDLPYVAYSENYSDKMRINGFKKGAKIYMSEIANGFSPAPSDGLILRGEDVKLALVYDATLQKFKSFYQE
ncbi:MAG: FG-GAP repeat protein [Sphingobacterium hotanense]